jgi:hypothetical protein
MKIKILSEPIKYDGSQISPLWGFHQGVEGDSIIVFQGPMDISVDHMKDLEDLKSGKKIRGESLLHFIVERFDSPASIRLAYYMQRLLVACAQEVLESKGIKTTRDGDDLFVGKKKLSVSIASSGVTSEKIHLGINLTSKGTPEDVETIGLLELGLEDWQGLGRSIAEMFAREVEDIERDIVKTKSL